MSVLMTPRNVPATMTPTISAVCEAWNTPIRPRRTVNPASAPPRPVTSPIRREIAGATKTANTASIRPQPKNT